MKKFLYILVLTILFSNIILAQETNLNINQILQTTTMPSDNEIMQMVELFVQTDEEKQFLFNETKKKLELLYNTKEASSLIDAHQNSINANNATNNIQKNSVAPKKRVKKYTNHPPLTKEWRKK